MNRTEERTMSPDDCRTAAIQLLLDQQQADIARIGELERECDRLKNQQDDLLAFVSAISAYATARKDPYLRNMVDSVLAKLREVK